MLAGILTERRRSLEKSKTVSGAPQLWRPRHTTGVTGYRVGAGEGNRTLVVSLGSFCSTIELHPPSRRISKPTSRHASSAHGRGALGRGKLGQERPVEGLGGLVHHPMAGAGDDVEGCIRLNGAQEI